jgi:hypothetical protein
MLSGQRVIVISGAYFRKISRNPKVWPMSPILTVCQEERRRRCSFVEEEEQAGVVISNQEQKITTIPR